MNNIFDTNLAKEFSFSLKERKVFESTLKNLGYEKCYDYLKCFRNCTKYQQGLVPFKDYLYFISYDDALSNLLFQMLKVQENSVKAFLSNIYHDVKIEIEERPSNYSKTKYYFKIPYGNNKFLDIRTFSYEIGPVDFYDAIKTLDFGDVNLIFFHLDDKLISYYSKNSNIKEEMDFTRKLRNYVYHHNILFSFGNATLKKAILFLLNNFTESFFQKYFKKEINKLADAYRKKDLTIAPFYLVNIYE